jgi:tetratricopeptide (TPR) repeat protein
MQFRDAALSVVVITVVWGVFLGPLRATPPETTLSVESAAALAADVDRLVRSDRLVDAIPGLEALLAQNEANDYYLLLLARAYGAAKRPADAVPLWERFIERSPVPLEACPDIGIQNLALSRPAAATNAFERCLAFEPANTDNALRLAVSYERGGQSEKALELYRKFAAAAPGYLDFSIGAARLELRTGALDAAHTRIARVVDSHADNSDALLVLGMVLEQRDDLIGAAAALERGVRLAPTDLDFYQILGRVAERRGKLDEARRWYTELVARDPTHAGGLTALKRIGGGQ